MKKRQINWKRNLRKIPDWVLAKLKTFKKNEVIVACVKKVTDTDIQSGKYSLLSISIKNGKPIFSTSVVPSDSVGKYSDWDVNGLEVVKCDLPKVSKTFSWDAPDYGGWSRVSREVSIDRGKGKIETAREVVAIVKTKTSNWQKVKTAVLKLHPYETPCIMKIPVRANAAFEKWIRAETR